MLLDKQGTSRSPIVTLGSLRNGNHRRGRETRCTWLTLHYSRVQSWESFRAAKSGDLSACQAGGNARRVSLSRKGRNTREKLLGGNNRVMRRLNCLGPNERAGNRRRIRCHVTFPYIPRRDGCIACLLDRSIPREGKLVEDEQSPLDISLRFLLSNNQRLDNQRLPFGKLNINKLWLV